jgi:hypothetical protein
MARARETKRTDILQVYRSTHACEHPESSTALVALESFDEWVAKGCPSRLDLTDAERAVVVDFLAARSG